MSMSEEEETITFRIVEEKTSKISIFRSCWYKILLLGLLLFMIVLSVVCVILLVQKHVEDNFSEVSTQLPPAQSEKIENSTKSTQLPPAKIGNSTNMFNSMKNENERNKSCC